MNRDTVTVHIFRDIYEKCKNRAVSERYEIREFLSELLSNCIDKEEFIRKQLAPHLSVDSCEDGRMVIKDMKERKLIDVYLRNLELQCEFHNTTDCIHTRYGWTRPELAQIVKAKKNLMVI